MLVLLLWYLCGIYFCYKLWLKTCNEDITVVDALYILLTALLGPVIAFAYVLIVYGDKPLIKRKKD